MGRRAMAVAKQQVRGVAATVVDVSPSGQWVRVLPPFGPTVRIFMDLCDALALGEPGAVSAYRLVRRLKISWRDVIDSLNWLVAAGYLVEVSRDRRGMRVLALPASGDDVLVRLLRSLVPPAHALPKMRPMMAHLPGR